MTWISAVFIASTFFMIGHDVAKDRIEKRVREEVRKQLRHYRPTADAYVDPLKNREGR